MFASLFIFVPIDDLLLEDLEFDARTFLAYQRNSGSGSLKLRKQNAAVLSKLKVLVLLHTHMTTWRRGRVVFDNLGHVVIMVIALVSE